MEIKLESAKTPDSYLRTLPEGKKLSKTMSVWKVQDTNNNVGKAGAVSDVITPEEHPDAEAILLGFAPGKSYLATGIGRHGNFLQWGWSASPSQMTPAGRNLFINSICYIHKFDGKAPLIHRSSSHRLNALRLAAVINRISGEKKEFFMRTFPTELWETYGSDPDGLVQYYKENLEFIYRDKVFLIDSELKSLGLNSNRSVDSLEQLIGLLEDNTNADTAMRLLTRYTNQTFQNAEDWKQWFENNRDRIFFSDVGGYKYFIIPKGYLSNQ